MRKRIVFSESNNPFYNIALEQWLFQSVDTDEIVLYFWQNEKTVVIGRNQNPWLECDCNLLESENGFLARRPSGGGAVYHDLGNLNFTFIAQKPHFDLNVQNSVILRAIESFGVKPCLSGRNDMLLDGRKFSGHAYCYTKTSSLQHGTILLNTDFNALERYLRPSVQKLRSKGVDSVRSRVVNLSEAVPTLSLETLKSAILDVFNGLYKGETLFEMDMLPNRIYEKFASWEWRYGKTPKFDVEWQYAFSWGELRIRFLLENGIIKHCECFSDAMEYEIFPLIAKSLYGIPFDKAEIRNSILRFIEKGYAEHILNDLLAML